MDNPSYALSGDDILRINPNTNLILYEDVSMHPNIDSLLHPYDSCIILYEWSRKNGVSVGHYVTLNRIKGDLIEFFDSYGMTPDKPLEQLRNSSEQYKKWTKQDNQYLLKRLINTPHQVSYNQYRLQNPSDAIATCGRYAVLRTLYKNLTLENFVKMLKNVHPNFDIAVTMLTA